MTRGEILDEAKKCVCGNREQEYGKPENNFKLVSKLWTDYTGTVFSAKDVAMMMALLKVARIKTGVKADSFVDLAGYAACAGEIAASNEGTSTTSYGANVKKKLSDYSMAEIKEIGKQGEKIKFRGKVVDTGEWVYGGYVHYNDIKDGGKDDCDYIVEKHNGEYFPFRQVIPETIGRFTGLYDKNGKEIYEGDILQGSYGDVVFEPEAVCWDDFDCTFAIDEMTFGATEIDMYNYIVVGNVFDNPELLEVEDK